MYEEWGGDCADGGDLMLVVVVMVVVAKEQGWERRWGKGKSGGYTSVLLVLSLTKRYTYTF